MNIERAPTPKRMLPEKLIYLSMRGASPVDQTGGAEGVKFSVSMGKILL